MPLALTLALSLTLAHVCSQKVGVKFKVVQEKVIEKGSERRKGTCVQTRVEWSTYKERKSTLLAPTV